MSAALSLESATLGYENVNVLERLSLSVAPGESVALLGPNGSGKSTLLKAVTRTAAIKAGKVHVAGTEVRSMGFDELARRVAFVPQEEPAHFPFTVREAVTLGRLPMSSGIRDSESDHSAATAAMEQADCLAFEGRRVTELSGGERQRVLIARALAQGAPLLLLDEPTAHLDVSHQLAIASLLAGWASEGRTTVAAVHDLNLAVRFATRAVLLADGKIGLDGPVEDVLENRLLDEVYQTRFSRIRLESGRLALVADAPT